MTDLCDFAFYQERYKGTVTEADFIRFSRRAQAFLSFATRGKSEQELFQEEKTKLALCAVTDEMAKEERTSAIQSEKAGQYSVTYQSGGRQTDCYRAASLYLEGEALYRGCGQC